MPDFPIDGVFAYRPASSLPQDGMLAPGWFAISHRHLAGKEDRRRAYGRWCRIRSESSTVFRTLRFSPTLSYSAADGEPSELCIDWGAWLKLSGFASDTEQPLAITIDRIAWMEWPWCVLDHPDPATRAAWMLGIVSLGLGLVSLLIAFV